MLDRLQSWLGFKQDETVEVEAASQLKPITPPRRLQRGLKAVPSHLRSAKPDPNSRLLRTDRRLASTDLSRITRQQGSREIIRELAHASPDLSASMFSFARTGITRTYTCIARNLDGTINSEATKLAQQLLTRFDLLPDYSEGYAGAWSIRSISEAWAKELFLYGSIDGELVLGPDRLPQRIQPLTTTTIEFKPDKEGVRPVQVVGGEEIDLDIPTFFHVALDMELQEAYASSPIESAIKPALFSEQFLADVQRVMRRAIHPRIKVQIDWESFQKYMPAEAQHDQDAAAKYYEDTVAAIEQQMNSLQPEDALVYNDMLEISLESNGNISLSNEYSTLEHLSNAKMSTGAKVLPAILGHSTGSSNVASTETLVFMKSAEGMIQFKLNEMFSKIMTLAVRLFGLDVYVEFRWEDIDLRPQSEMESFKQAKQSRVLELLSLGLIADEEASIQLTGHLPPDGYRPLSGTYFRSAMPTDENLSGGKSNDGSTLNQKLNSDAPTQSRGSNNKRNPVKGGNNA